MIELAPKNGQPRQGIYPAGAVDCCSRIPAKGPVSRILSCAVIPLGAALPRTLISDLPGGFGTCSSHLSRIGQIRSATWLLRRRLSSLFGLAPCGVYPASDVTAGAVRSYRTFSPLPGLAVQAIALRAGPPERSENRIQVGGMFSVALAVYEP